MISTETEARTTYNIEDDIVNVHIEIDIGIPYDIAKGYKLPGMMLIDKVTDDMWNASLIAAALCLDGQAGVFPPEMVEFAIETLAKITPGAVGSRVASSPIEDSTIYDIDSLEKLLDELIEELTEDIENA